MTLVLAYNFLYPKIHCLIGLFALSKVIRLSILKQLVKIFLHCNMRIMITIKHEFKSKITTLGNINEYTDSPGRTFSSLDPSYFTPAGWEVPNLIEYLLTLLLSLDNHNGSQIITVDAGIKESVFCKVL